MEIKVIRKWPKRDYTIGQMFIDGTFFCHTLEPSLTRTDVRPAIPAGTYKVQMYPSAKFKGMRPILLNVPRRSGILIHEGNYPSNTQGCILVGINSEKGMVLQSKITLDKLIGKINAATEQVTISIQ